MVLIVMYFKPWTTSEVANVPNVWQIYVHVNTTNHLRLNVLTKPS